jgi:hypothetical protein
MVLMGQGHPLFFWLTSDYVDTGLYLHKYAFQSNRNISPAELSRLIPGLPI